MFPSTDVLKRSQQQEFGMSCVVVSEHLTHFIAFNSGRQHLSKARSNSAGRLGNCPNGSKDDQSDSELPVLGAHRFGWRRFNLASTDMDIARVESRLELARAAGVVCPPPLKWHKGHPIFLMSADLFLRAESALAQSKSAVKRCRGLHQEHVRRYLMTTNLRLSIECLRKSLAEHWAATQICDTTAISQTLPDHVDLTAMPDGPRRILCRVHTSEEVNHVHLLSLRLGVSGRGKRYDGRASCFRRPPL